MNYVSLYVSMTTEEKSACSNIYYYTHTHTKTKQCTIRCNKMFLVKYKKENPFIPLEIGQYDMMFGFD